MYAGIGIGVFCWSTCTSTSTCGTGTGTCGTGTGTCGTGTGTCGTGTGTCGTGTGTCGAVQPWLKVRLKCEYLCIYYELPNLAILLRHCRRSFSSCYNRMNSSSALPNYIAACS